MTHCIHLIAWIVILLFVPVLRAGDFAIRDGDTVVFLGDSITAERTYGKLIENYTLLRYPERRVRFINAGWGGDTAAGGLARLERDVFARGATLLTVAYGINDIGWGTKADDEHRNRYLESIRGIVEACRKRGVRVYICSAALTAGDTGEDNYLQKMCDEGMALARSLGERAIDVQGTMRTIQQRVKRWNADHKDSKETLHAPDGIHLNGLGQFAMGFAILKGLGPPAEVSSATLSAKETKVLASQGCRISEVELLTDGIAFTRLDEGLPLNLEPLWQLQFRFIPFPEVLNRYMLSVTALPRGRYEVRAAGRLVGTWDERQLADGVNLGSATPDGWIPGGPWDAQAHLLKRLTDARTQIALARLFSPEFLEEIPSGADTLSDLDGLDEKLVDAQRRLARPSPYRFVIQRVGAPAPSASGH